MHNDHDSFTECVLVGGPFDGRREMVNDSADELKLWVADAENIDQVFGSSLMPAVYGMRTVSYYRKKLTAEGLRRPLEIFVTDREASTGWLIQKILMAYPGPKTND